jgi:hypothetical protein
MSLRLNVTPMVATRVAFTYGNPVAVRGVTVLRARKGALAWDVSHSLTNAAFQLT